MKENSVLFKGKKDGILIILDNKIPFEELKEILKTKVKKAQGFFRGANASITFKGRSLSDDDEMELLDIVSKSSGLNISFVNVSEENKDLFRPKVPYITAKQNITYYHKGSIRGGQELHFSGSIVILGDVHPGSKVIAEGNIIVLGTLKGLAHAGCKGAIDSFISSLNMKTSQLRIADLIVCIPDKHLHKSVPEYAHVKENQICIEPL